MRISSLLVVLLLSGCSLQHVPSNGGNPDSGTAMPDMSLLDGGAPDASSFDGALPDAPIFDAIGDTADSSTPVLSCVIEVGTRDGEGCFCPGPLVGFDRHGHLFRQSLGIEMYAVGRLSLSPVHTIEEEASARGGLALLPGHLLSVADWGENPIRVYSLPEHSWPVRVARFGEGQVTLLTTASTATSVGAAWQEDAETLVFADLSDPLSPEVLWRQSINAQSIAITNSAVVVITRDGTRGGVHVFDRVTGRPLARLELEEEADSIRAFGDRVYLLGGPARVTEVLLGDTLSLGRSLGSSSHRFETLIQRSDGVAVLSQGLMAFSIEHFEEIPISIETPGFVADSLWFESLVDDGDLLFGSNGSAVRAMAMTCE